MLCKVAGRDGAGDSRAVGGDRVQPAEQPGRAERAGRLGQDESGGVFDADAGKTAGERARQRYRRVGKRGRRGEPVRRGDVGGNGKAVIEGRLREQPIMTASSPKVATNSANHWPGPVRTCCDTDVSGRSNMPCAATTPAQAPTSCTAM